MRHYRQQRILACLLSLLLLLAGCASGGGFEPGKLGKSDVDLVADTHVRVLEAHLRELTIKLYKRNPGELRKGRGQPTLESRLEQLFGQKGRLRFEELGNAGDIDAMLLGFDEHYAGDRVFAIMAGLTDMLRKSYGYREQFYLLDEINQQKLYDSARNIEILVWRLNQRRSPDGRPWLLTNEPATAGEPGNLSFERLFGKMISVQDMMANIMADRSQRAINRVVHGLASMAFLPI